MRSSFFRCLILSFLAGSVLNAQVDSRLQKSATDVLDIYGGGKSAAKPEIITLIDDSGSMAALAWDSRYYSNSAGNLHSNGLGIFGSNATVVSSSLYTGITFTVKIGDLTEGLLIKPDGTPVISTDVGGSTDKLKWVARASHVRMAITSKAYSTSPTYTYPTTSPNTTYRIPSSNCGKQAKGLTTTGTDAGKYKETASDISSTDKTRVVDIPLPWAVFDRVPTYEQRSLSPAPSNLSTAKADKHPQHLYLFDPVPDASGNQTAAAQYYEIDTTWWESAGNWGLNGQLLSTEGDNSGRFVGFTFNEDYLSWCFFGKDIRNNDGTGAYQSGMTDTYTGSTDGYVVADARSGAAGFCSFPQDGVTRTGNGLPAMTRLQSIKYAVIKTYITEQNNVWWAIRFLNLGDGGTSGFKENGRSTAPGCFNSDNLKGTPGDRKLLRLLQPTSSQTPDTNMQYIQRKKSNLYTPLTFALLNTYAQMASDDNGASGSVFADNKTETPIPSCRKSFVVVLSDGQPNDDKSDSSGGDGNAIKSGDPFSSGTFSTILFGTIAPTKDNFNIFTLAGVAAHVTPSAADAKAMSGWPTSDANTKNKLGILPPFLITSRPTGTTRRINTMTIGVSLPGTIADADSPKGAMYKAALYGWEARGSFNAASLPLPYERGNSARNDKDKNPFFFDAQSPDGIADALAESFAQARSVTNTMSAPVAPLVGLGVGNQMYVGTFTTGSNIPAWSGDLLMTGMKIIGSSVQLLHKDGQPLTGGVNKDSAVWSAAVMLGTKGWKNRTLYTLKPDPAHAGKFLQDLLLWNEGTSAGNLPNDVINVGTTSARLSLLRYMMGASKEAQDSLDSVTSITASRDDIMGDIINSTPAILEFPVSKAPSSLTSALGTHYPGETITSMRFRLIMVGTNQGILHGFGELSGTNESGLVRGVVDELWGFIPPDILGGIQAWYTGTTHRYLMDGSPIVYLNEQGIPNGMADGTGSTLDFVRVVFGLRKGGRSYYCLSFTGNDPTVPVMSWMLRPDDSTDTTIKNMGFSTSTPAAARVYDGSSLTDVFFLGGGLSTTDVDTAFSSTLGRSLLAVNVYSGTVVKKWDFVNDTTLKRDYPSMGCIASAVVPVEVIAGSYKAQRVYFSDHSGGVYALGAKASSGLRTDTSVMDSWSTRTIFKSSYPGTTISTSPAVFPLPNGYPVIRSAAPTGIVAAMGVVFGQGDRNDPMDKDAINPDGGGSGLTNRHRLIMVLDRQDSADIKNAANAAVDSAGYTDTSGNSGDLADLTTVTTANLALVTPSNSSYYLKSKSGYLLNFAPGVVKPGSRTTYYYEKAVTSPLVLNGSLFFTKFAPNVTIGECQGAGGTSTTYRMNSVLNPVYNSGNTDASANSADGWVAKFNDIPSELATAGMGAVIQVGEVRVGDTGIGTVLPVVLPTAPLSTLPRPRAWRIVR